MTRATKTIESLVTQAAGGAWSAMQLANRALGEPAAFLPRWSDKPIPRGKSRTKPPLGWPRETDSLCPRCVKEAREAILRGDEDIGHLIHGKPGEIKALIHEKAGRIVMEKTCPLHGAFEDTISIDPKFLARLEELFPGRDVEMTPDAIHNHGSSTIKHTAAAPLRPSRSISRTRCNLP